jgi:hypothetical protein
MRTSLVGLSKFPCPHSHVKFTEPLLISNVSITQTRFSGTGRVRADCRSLSGPREINRCNRKLGAAEFVGTAQMSLRSVMEWYCGRTSGEVIRFCVCNCAGYAVTDCTGDRAPGTVRRLKMGRNSELPTVSPLKPSINQL